MTPWWQTKNMLLKAENLKLKQSLLDIQQHIDRGRLNLGHTQYDRGYRDALTHLDERMPHPARQHTARQQGTTKWTSNG